MRLHAGTFAILSLCVVGDFEAMVRDLRKVQGRSAHERQIETKYHLGNRVDAPLKHLP